MVKQAIYRAQGVEVNDVRVSLTGDGGSLVVTDRGAVIASGDGCVTDPVDSHRASCALDGAALSRTDLELGAANDTLSVARGVDEDQNSALSVWADGGDGADDLIAGGGRNSLRGGTGNDTLTGGQNFDYLNGDEGDDQLDGGAGDDALDGGLGADTIVGGDGRDQVSYTARLAAVHVDLEGDRDDGQGGERDLVHASIESVSGGHGSDEIFGDDRANFLDGGLSGEDLLVGAGGDDYLQLSPYLAAAAGPDRGFGGDGDDRLEGGGHLDGAAGNDILSGAGVDVLLGGEGDDQLWGAGGRDRLDGGPGNDDIDARFGSYSREPRDRDPGDDVDCGSGEDIVFPSEDVLRNCEQLAVRASCHSRANCVASGALIKVSRPRRTVGGGRVRLGYAGVKLVLRLSESGLRTLRREGRFKVRSDVTVRAWNYRPKSRPDEPNRRGKVSIFRSTYSFTLAAP